jgi:hypothetical protein
MIISYSPELGSLNISQTKIKMNTLAFILCGNETIKNGTQQYVCVFPWLASSCTLLTE